MKRPVKALKIIIITVVTMIVLLAGTVVLASAYPDHPILQFFVIENPFTVPEQETFPIVQILEENNLTQDRIDNIQFAVLPDGGLISLTDKAQFQAVWELLSAAEVTTTSARHAPVNESLSIYVDIQFIDPNHNAGIEIFGQVYILGRGPFVFTDSTIEQRFIDMFTSFTNIHVDYTPPEPFDPEEDSGPDIIVYPTPATANMDFSTFLELFEANGFIYDEIIDESSQNGERFLSVEPKRIIIGDEIINVYEFSSNEEMETEAGYIDTGGSGITRPDSGVQISWVSTPYWFKSDLIIVLYVGTNREILNFLMETFGQPFAGGIII